MLLRPLSHSACEVCVCKPLVSLNVAQHHSSGGKWTREKGSALNPISEPLLYLQIFSHVSYGTSHNLSSPIAPCVPVTGVSLTVTA